MDTKYDSHFQQGVTQFKAKNFEGAIEQLTQCLNIRSDSYAALLNRGTSYTYLGQYMLAVHDLTKAIEIDSKDPSAYYNLAIVYLKAQNRRKALGYLYSCLSCLYIQKGVKTKEIKFITKAISLVENNLHAYVERGKLYEQQGNKMMALNDYSGAIEIDSTQPEIYALRGNLYHEMGEQEDAEADLNQVLLLGSNSQKQVVLVPTVKEFSGAALIEEINKRLREVHQLRCGMMTNLSRKGSGVAEEAVKNSRPNTDRQPAGQSEAPAASANGDVDESALVREKIEKLEAQIKQFREEKIENTSVIVPTDNLLEVSLPLSKPDEEVPQEQTSGIAEDSLEKQRREAAEKALKEKQLSFKDFNTDNQIDQEIQKTQANAVVPIDTSLTDQVKPQQDKQEKVAEIPKSENSAQFIVLENVVPSDSGEKASTKPQLQTPAEPKTILEVEIVAGVLTHDTEIWGTMSPYCRVTYGKQIKDTTVQNKGGKNPVWNEVLHFRYDEKIKQLQIEVYDKEFVKKDDFVGSGNLRILDVNHKCVLKFNGSQAGIVYVKSKLV